MNIYLFHDARRQKTLCRSLYVWESAIVKANRNKPNYLGKLQYTWINATHMRVVQVEFIYLHVRIHNRDHDLFLPLRLD